MSVASFMEQAKQEGKLINVYTPYISAEDTRVALDSAYRSLTQIPEYGALSGPNCNTYARQLLRLAGLKWEKTYQTIYTLAWIWPTQETVETFPAGTPGWDYKGSNSYGGKNYDIYGKRITPKPLPDEGIPWAPPPWGGTDKTQQQHEYRNIVNGLHGRRGGALADVLAAVVAASIWRHRMNERPDLPETAKVNSTWYLIRFVVWFLLGLAPVATISVLGITYDRAGTGVLFTNSQDPNSSLSVRTPGHWAVDVIHVLVLLQALHLVCGLVLLHGNSWWMVGVVLLLGTCLVLGAAYIGFIACMGITGNWL
jgi:hypothetical protein